MSDPIDDPNTEIARDMRGCGCLSMVLLLMLVVVCWCEPGDVATFWCWCSTGSNAHANTFIENGRSRVYVCSGDVELLGQPIKWVVRGEEFRGVWLKGHLIGMEDGSVVSDDVLPRMYSSYGESGGIVDSLPAEVRSLSMPPIPPLVVN